VLSFEVTTTIVAYTSACIMRALGEMLSYEARIILGVNLN